MEQWCFFFIFYCVIGWCFETAYVSICQKHFVNRGFLHGPYLPIYGSGAIIMLFVTIPFRGNLVLCYLSGMAAATILEYVTGVVMEALFQVRYWDYSDKKFHFQGHICLSSSLTWGVFAILLNEYIHKPVERLNLAIPKQILTVVVTVAGAVMLVDFTLSVRAAISLRDVLVRMAAAKKELELLQKRMDVMLAFSEDYAVKKKQELLAHRDDLVAALEERFAQLRSNSFADSVKDELDELREKFIVLRTRQEDSMAERAAVWKKMFRNQPTMKSKRFHETLEHLKTLLEEKKRS